MALPGELIAEFAKLIRNDNTPTETTVYGTIVETGGSKYLVIDGSTILTPIATTVDALSGERVTAIIKDHSVVVTGNLSSPAARVGQVSTLETATSNLSGRTENLEKNFSISAILDVIYPIGSIYQSIHDTDPSTLFGGSWVPFMPGRVLIGAGEADSGTVYEAGATGGEETHTLTLSEMPNHHHAPIAHSGTTGKRVGLSNGTADESTSYYKLSYTDTSGYIGTALYTSKNGGGGAHNNMQPYGVIYRWLRIA